MTIIQRIQEIQRQFDFAMACSDWKMIDFCQKEIKRLNDLLEFQRPSMEVFLQEYCDGLQYDSCVESPCPFSSHSGCTNPMHPKNYPGKL